MHVHSTRLTIATVGTGPLTNESIAAPATVTNESISCPRHSWTSRTLASARLNGPGTVSWSAYT